MIDKYLTPKPIGRDYTEQELKLVEKIEKSRVERDRAKRIIKDAYSLYGQVQRKYEHKAITVKPAVFDKNTMDLADYYKLTQQEERHRKDTGQDELLKHRNLISEKETAEHCAYLDLCNKIEMLKELIKNNDHLLKSK